MAIEISRILQGRQTIGKMHWISSTIWKDCTLMHHQAVTNLLTTNLLIKIKIIM